MMVTASGVLVGVVHREASSGIRRDGTMWENEAATFALLATDFNSYPSRVRLSGAQTTQLDDRALFGREVEVTGKIDKDGQATVIDCASFKVKDPAHA